MEEQPQKDERDAGLKKTYRIGCLVLIIIIAVLAFSYLFGYMEF